MENKHKQVKIHTVSEYGAVTYLDLWPCLTRDEVLLELGDMLNCYRSDDIIDGITLSLNYVSIETGEPNYQVGIDTTGCNDIDAVRLLIESGDIEWSGLQEFHSRTVVEL